MIKIVCLLFALVLVCAGFAGCGETAVITQAPEGLDHTNWIESLIADVKDVADFKCVVELGDGTNRLVTGDNAKALYRFVTGAWKSAENAETPESVDGAIRLNFQTGKPVYVTEHETEPESDATPEYFGEFFILEDDTVEFSGSPFTSYAVSYHFPDGFYNQLKDRLTMYS